MLRFIALPSVLVVLSAGSLKVSAQTASIPKLRGTVDLTIGGSDADEDASFGRISGLAVDKSGRIFAADVQDHLVKMFSPTGKLVSRIGRKGSGPLEFTRIATIVIGPDQLLWTRDEGNARMLGIDVSGSPAKPVKNIPLVSFTGGAHNAITFEPDGSIVDETIWYDKATDLFRPLRLRRNASGVVTRTDTLVVPVGANAGRHKVTAPQKDASGKVIGMSQQYYFQPHGPDWRREYGPGGIRAEVVTSKYEVQVYDAKGQPLHVLRRVVPAVPLSAREKRRADSMLTVEDVSLPFKVPSNKAPVLGLKYSLDGELWVERAVADGAPREADIFDQRGRLVATASWPRAYDLTDWRTVITGRTVTLVASDDDGLQSIVRLQFR